MGIRVWKDYRLIRFLIIYLWRMKREIPKHCNDLDRIRALENENKELEEENKKLKETIKDHQLYEEKLEHRIIEFEELLHWE